MTVVIMDQIPLNIFYTQSNGEVSDSGPYGPDLSQWEVRDSSLCGPDPFQWGVRDSSLCGPDPSHWGREGGE